MVAKKRNFDMRTTLMILLVVVIALAVVYVILTPSEESDEGVLTVDTIEELRLNKDYYEGKTVKITGIYRINDGNRDSLNPPTTDADPTSEDYIYLDLSGINLTQNPAIAGDKYEVIGKVVITTEGVAHQIQIITESFTKV